MLTAIHPKLPMRNKAATKKYYTEKLGFTDDGGADYPEYLMLKNDGIEIHFFLFTTIDPATNYSGVYIRTDDIDILYQSLPPADIHPNGPLQIKPWGQKEFAMLDPDNNLLTFGQSI